jgi:tetratricopeptide (TPR) repeat protein
MAERLNSPVERSSALLTLALIYSVRGMLRERLEIAQQALAITSDPRFDNVPERIHSLIGVSAALIHLGEYAAAIPHITEAERFADQIRAVDLQNRTLSLRVYCWFRLDRWDEMQATEARRRELQRMYRLERLGAPCFSIGLAGAVHGLQGKTERARALQAESTEIMRRVSGPPERWGRSHYY